MDRNQLISQFDRIGARVRTVETDSGGLRLDVRKDRGGQIFELAAPPRIDVRIVDVEAPLRHLLLISVDPTLRGAKRRFLCGHDEREWFVAAVPGNGVARIRRAMEALKPLIVRQEQDRAGVRNRERLRRRTAACIRQGEWFFLPRPGMNPPASLVLRDEPLARPGGKPHRVELLYRQGGETVMVCSRHPNGLTAREYDALLATNRAAKQWVWRTMRRNPTVHVKGTVRHPDHATVRLSGWHQVVMNTEREAPGARDVVFLD